MGQSSILSLPVATSLIPQQCRLSSCTLPTAFIISSATPCRTKCSSTWSNMKIGFVVKASTSTWRFVFTPIWCCWQVTHHPLLSPSQRKPTLYCLGPWFSLQKWGICPTWLHSYFGVASSLGLHAWPSLQISSLVWGILLGCNSRLAPKEIFLFWCPAVGVSMIQTGWGLQQKVTAKRLWHLRYNWFFMRGRGRVYTTSPVMSVKLRNIWRHGWRFLWINPCKSH